MAGLIIRKLILVLLFEGYSVKNILCIIIIVLFSITTISCSKKEDSDLSESTDNSTDNSTTEDFSISSSADNETVNFGQTYQYDFTTSGGSASDNLTYTLSSGPDNMTISSSGLVEWTPTTSSDIGTHTITITVTTASGQTLTQTYDLVVTGTCVSGNVLSIWSGDQRTSTNSSSLLGNVTAYTDNGSDICGSSDNKECTAVNNYYYHDSSVDLTWGPTPTATTGNVFFYNQYDNTSHLYLFYMFGVKGNSSADTINIDIFTDNNTSTDSVVVADDASSEIRKVTSGCVSSAGCYKGRHSYNNANSDGGVIGPFTGTDFRIFIDLGGTSTILGDSTTLTLGSLDSFKYYSKDNTSFALGAVDNFTIGYSSSVTCQ